MSNRATDFVDRPTVMVDTQFGPLESFADDFMNAQFEEFGNHTRPEFAFSISALDFDMNVFDLGAHIGSWSITAGRKLIQGQRILAVEGSPVTFALLTRNLARQPQAQVTAINAFVGPAGDFGYAEDLSNSGANALAPGGSAALNWQDIDDLAAQHFAPDYIKIDIEGYELRALSTSTFVRERRPILYLEVSKRQLAQFGDTVEDMNRFLSDLGYAVFRNAGDRNARHDVYKVAQIHHLDWYGNHHGLFDALCVPKESRIATVLRAACA